MWVFTPNSVDKHLRKYSCINVFKLLDIYAALSFLEFSKFSEEFSTLIE